MLTLDFRNNPKLARSVGQLMEVADEPTGMAIVLARGPDGQFVTDPARHRVKSCEHQGRCVPRPRKGCEQAAASLRTAVAAGRFRAK